MKILGNDIKVGNVLEHEKRLWVVLKRMHTQPGKGGAYVQVEMKDIVSGTKMNIRFRSGEAVEKAHLHESEFQFLYYENNMLMLMDNDTYEQISVTKDLLGDQERFLTENMIIKIQTHEGKPIAITLPDTVVVTIQECESTIKGQTASASYKPAILENGIRIMVPSFIVPGDKIIVKVITGEYEERAK